MSLPKPFARWEKAERSDGHHFWRLFIGDRFLHAYHENGRVERIADEINVIHEAYIRAAIEAFAESKTMDTQEVFNFSDGKKVLDKTIEMF